MPSLVHQADIGRGDLAVQRLDLFRRFEQRALVEHIRNLELLDDLLVFDRHVLLVLIEVEQLLPRRRQVFISGEHRDQRAERELALDHKITADQKEQEWRKISDQIVEEFNEEFAIIDLEPNIVNFTQALRDVGKLVNGARHWREFRPARRSSRRYGPKARELCAPVRGRAGE